MLSQRHTLSGRANLLAELENVDALQPFTLAGSGGLLPQVLLGVLTHIVVHSDRRLIIFISIGLYNFGLGEKW